MLLIMFGNQTKKFIKARQTKTYLLIQFKNQTDHPGQEKINKINNTIKVL